jgi:hypothetical protein
MRVCVVRLRPGTCGLALARVRVLGRPAWPRHLLFFFLIF